MKTLALWASVLSVVALIACGGGDSEQPSSEPRVLREGFKILIWDVESGRHGTVASEDSVEMHVPIGWELKAVDGAREEAVAYFVEDPKNEGYPPFVIISREPTETALSASEVREGWSSNNDSFRAFNSRDGFIGDNAAEILEVEYVSVDQKVVSAFTTLSGYTWRIDCNAELDTDSEQLCSDVIESVRLGG